jgi:hypothetical protein
MTDPSIHDTTTRAAPAPTDAIADAKQNILNAIEAIDIGLLQAARMHMHKAVRNLTYAAAPRLAEVKTADAKAEPLRNALLRASYILKGAAEGDSVQVSAGQLLPDIRAALTAPPAVDRVSSPASDIGILLSALRNHEDATGEDFDDEGGVIAQIERDYLAGIITSHE